MEGFYFQLGPKLFIPMPNLENFRIWYSRKDSNLTERVKGCKDVEKGCKKHGKRYFMEYDALLVYH